jgi:hypothetical protein
LLSDVDEPESNKSSAHVEARIMPLPPVEAERIFLPAIFTVTAVAFSATLSPKDFMTNLLLHFMGLARVRSSAEVYPQNQMIFSRVHVFLKFFLALELAPR